MEARAEAAPFPLWKWLEAKSKITAGKEAAAEIAALSPTELDYQDPADTNKTLLHYAVKAFYEKKNRDNLTTLLNANADANLEATDRGTPLHYFIGLFHTVLSKNPYINAFDQALFEHLYTHTNAATHRKEVKGVTPLDVADKVGLRAQQVALAAAAHPELARAIAAVLARRKDRAAADARPAAGAGAGKTADPA